MDADWIEGAGATLMDESDTLQSTQGSRKPKDRDFVETHEGMFFCVTGYLHPPDRYTAYLKYSPVSEGKWKSGETSYHRELEYYHVDQVARTISYLERAYPQYVHYCPVRDIKFSMVPHVFVRKYYLPEQRFSKILKAPQDPLEEELNVFASEIVAIAGIEAADLGITGSILLGLHNPSFSDIDLLVYGLENAQKVRTALKEGRSSRIQPVSGETLEEWCTSVTEHFSLDYKEACHLAKRRWNYGFFEGRYFSIHATRKEDEIRENYGDRIYREVGAARIRAVVTDASESLFMPAVYRVEAVEVIESTAEEQRAASLQEVVSYEGLYRDVVDEGEEIEAFGKLEHINGQSYRLLVGTTGRRGGGYIRPALLKEG
jgi:predicted nucleotidyltransferase